MDRSDKYYCGWQRMFKCGWKLLRKTFWDHCVSAIYSAQIGQPYNSCSWLPDIAWIIGLCACVWWWLHHGTGVCLVFSLSSLQEPITDYTCLHQVASCANISENEHLQAGSDTGHGKKESVAMVCVQINTACKLLSLAECIGRNSI